MMKSVKYIVLASAICAIVYGCGLDYNESSIYSKDEMFRQRTEGVDKLVWGIYGQLDYDCGYNWTYGAMLSSASDESICPWAESTIHDFYNGRWSARNPNTDPWNKWYSAIRQANFFLEEASELTFDDYRYNKDYNDYLKKYGRYKYEVRLLRAYFYFNLVRTYGDVPLIVDVLDQEDADTVRRAPADKIFDFICSECDAVASMLPTDYESETYQETGRVTRQTAYALKARTLLYAASPLFNVLNDPQRWIDAAEANWDAIEECRKYGAAIGTYQSLWGSDSYRNPEIIYCIRQSESIQFERYNFPMGVEGGNSGNCPTQTLVDAYELRTTGKIWSESGEAYNPDDPYADLDPRFGMTIAKAGDMWPEYNTLPLQPWYGGLNGQPLPGATTTGYYLKKYCDGTVDLRPNSTSSKRHSFITFRLGELYLNYAEAVWHVLGSADVSSDRFPMSANEAVNVLRSRSDVNMPGFEGNDNFFERYMRERMVELAFEGHRLWDVRRWKLGKESFSSVTVMEITGSGDRVKYERKKVEREWDDRMYFFPIPYSELKTNKNLVQNKGW